MPRPLRIEYTGAIYHVINRGDRREVIFLVKRSSRSATRGVLCLKAPAKVHAPRMTTSYLLFNGTRRQDCHSLRSRNPLSRHRHLARVRWREKFCQISTVRVLIADDQRSVGTTLAALVTQCGHEVVEVVGSGFDAIQSYTRHRPDVVLMDYWMPRLNGGTACRTILARYPDARIILISGTTLASEVSESGAIAILKKPVELDPLYAALYAAGSGQSNLPEPEE